MRRIEEGIMWISGISTSWTIRKRLERLESRLRSLESTVHGGDMTGWQDTARDLRVGLDITADGLISAGRELEKRVEKIEEDLYGQQSGIGVIERHSIKNTIRALHEMNLFRLVKALEKKVDFLLRQDDKAVKEAADHAMQERKRKIYDGLVE